MKYIIQTKDNKEAMRLFKSTDMALALWEICYNLRKKCIVECDIEAMEIGVGLVFDNIFEIISERNINIDDLID